MLQIDEHIFSNGWFNHQLLLMEEILHHLGYIYIYISIHIKPLGYLPYQLSINRSHAFVVCCIIPDQTLAPGSRSCNDQDVTTYNDTSCNPARPGCCTPLKTNMSPKRDHFSKEYFATIDFQGTALRFQGSTCQSPKMVGEAMAQGTFFFFSFLAGFFPWKIQGALKGFAWAFWIVDICQQPSSFRMLCKLPTLFCTENKKTSLIFRVEIKVSNNGCWGMSGT